MKIPLTLIINKEFSEAFARLLAMPLSGKAAYGMAKAARVFETEAKDFETARLAILKKYGKPDGKQFRIDDEHDLSDANSEMGLVLNRDIEVPLNPIQVPDDGIISGKDLLLLEPLLEAPVQKP